MKKGDILEVEIMSNGMNGEGIARVDNFVLFIPYTLIGEKVKVQIVDTKKSYANAKVIKLLEASPDRVTPKCPIFFQCGGCEMQHLKYEKQLEIKKANIARCLSHECKKEIPVEDVYSSGKMFGYRNKVQIPLRQINGVTKAGFYKLNSHTFVPFQKSADDELGDCVLHSKGIQSIVDIVCLYIDANKITTYNELNGTGLVRHLVIRRVDESYSICLVINGNKLPNKNELCDRLNKLKIQYSLYVSKNTDNTNVIMGHSVETLSGLDSIKGSAFGIDFFVNPMSFLQINDDIRNEIYATVMNEINKVENAVVIDAYSGIGITSNMIARYAKKVYGIEIVKEAVLDANKLAMINNNKNIENICGDVAIELPKLITKLKNETKVVLLDPPRKGCDNNVISAIYESEPEMIVYISCNPSTLARDVGALIDKYEIKYVKPFDMFPNTSHVETLVTLSRKN